MKASLIILALGFATVLSYPTSNGIDFDENEWALIPDGNGHLRLMNLKALKFEASLMPRVDTVARFMLYTKSNPNNPQELTINDIDRLRKSNYDVSRPTRFVTHGFINDGNSEVINVIRKAYLDCGDFNVVVIDWGSGSATINYIYARDQVSIAGGQAGAFMDFLNEQGTPLDNIYCAGHSLGAHVCGYAGKNTRRGRINTIFGLDTALPLFDINKPNERLSDNDAQYVQTIHTDGGRLGFQKAIGDASFYPNWGGVQPGCGIIADAAGVCSHSRSYFYFAESLKKPDNFVGQNCGDIANINKLKCPKTDSTARMGGEPSNHGITGLFYVPINSKAPYAKGNVF